MLFASIDELASCGDRRDSADKRALWRSPGERVIHEGYARSIAILSEAVFCSPTFEVSVILKRAATPCPSYDEPRLCNTSVIHKPRKSVASAIDFVVFFLHSAHSASGHHSTSLILLCFSMLLIVSMLISLTFFQPDLTVLLAASRREATSASAEIFPAANIPVAAIAVDAETTTRRLTC